MFALARTGPARSTPVNQTRILSRWSTYFTSICGSSFRRGTDTLVESLWLWACHSSSFMYLFCSLVSRRQIDCGVHLSALTISLSLPCPVSSGSVQSRDVQSTACMPARPARISDIRASARRTGAEHDGFGFRVPTQHLSRRVRSCGRLVGCSQRVPCRQRPGGRSAVASNSV